ncbi:hypothetical protein V6N13_019890 [Hibiscus sabdariffa]
MDEWNRMIFGSLSRWKNITMARLHGIQKSIDKFCNPFLIHLESQLKLELEQILNQEELLWKQKSRGDLIAFGDRNTSYFHTRAMQNKRTSRITPIKFQYGVWCSNKDDIHNEVVCFSRNCTHQILV